ncbi:biotin--[acetyl-CoA-carboxylase] ligase [Oceanobacillus massiliensis]|uniref:biotin--[acetyl-CoA-carboxylase] ligase n=1 Tax=Oceanobacillus massiliensis TaxID=1465765 RepID=UPI0002882E8F|nr:biotin--[acetyl-CoA-carboxylase] ligase [Oceanobacillus massiliensis]
MESTRDRLITLLAENEDRFISGQALSDSLHISRNAVWKHMKDLEKDGYQIEARPRKGYRITAYPETMSSNTIKWGLDTKWIAKTIIHKEKTGSTQTLAHQAALENAPHGTIVIADEQTEGRGRMNRTWHSNKGKGIWLSILLRPEMLPNDASKLTLLAATVLADVLESTVQTRAHIKWPNDILLNQKKIAGILTEMQAEQDRIQYILIGIGLNVNHSKEDLQEDIQSKATSLKIETGQDWPITHLIQELLKSFEKSFDAYMKSGFAPVKEKWESYGFKIGQPIQIKTFKDEWESTFLGISEEGALLTESRTGEAIKLYSAEINWFPENK